MIKDIHEVKICPSCGGDDLIYKDDDDQVVCKQCGTIFEPLAPEDEEAFEDAHTLS